MSILELSDSVNFFLAVGSIVDGYSDCGDAICYGASVNAVTAAYSTIGYWMQADLLQYLKLTNMGAWAPLVYIFAAFAGLFSMAMGMPPRNWMWFFIGPGVYWWLIDSPVQVDAVSWRVGNVAMDQAVVWEKAETGLKNTPLLDRLGGNVYKTKKPDNPVVVAMPFIWYDALISSTVQALISWTGIHNQKTQANSGVAAQDTNIAIQATTDEKAWFVLSTLKWQYLQDITAARLANVDARDLFARFFTNGCGDRLAHAIDPTRFLSASNTRGSGLPKTVFKGNSSIDNPQYNELKSELTQEWVPIPRSLRNILSDISQTSFRRAVNLDDSLVEKLLSLDRMRCDTYLHLLVYYFRWESGGVYEQMFTNTAPKGMTAHDISYNLFYGWDIKKNRGNGNPGEHLSEEDLKKYTKDLILLHMFRNELSLVPKPITAGATESELTAIRAESATRTIGSVQKFGEVYTWATMIPHVQGIVIMLLTMAYPFVAIIVLIPGFHGFLFTWMRYFAWAKIWDFGFALVTAIERSVWAALSTGLDSATINDRVMLMQKKGSVNLEGCDEPIEGTIGCFAPIIKIFDGAGAAAADPTSPDGFSTNLGIFDLALTVGSNLDLDLANGYYIYLMAALYFAVPAVTAQVLMVQGANFVDQATSEISQGAGRGAQQGYSGTLTQRTLSNQSTARQAMKAKSLRNSGLAHQAMAYENRAAELGLMASEQDQISSGKGRFAEQTQLNRQFRDQNRGLAIEKAKAVGILNSSTDSGTDSPRSTGDASTGDSLTGESSTGVGEDKIGGSKKNALDAKGRPQNANTSYSKWEDAGQDSISNTGLGKAMAAGLPDSYKGLSPASAVPLISKAGEANAFISAGVAEMGHKARGGEAGINSFGARGLQESYRGHTERLNAQADFEAESATYDMMNRFADQLTSDVVVAGSANIGQLDPGRRPEEMRGMAMSGMLNTATHNTRRAANYFNPVGGQHRQRLSGMKRDLTKNFGYRKLMSGLQIGTPEQEIMSSTLAVGKETQRSFGGTVSGLAALGGK